MVVLGDMPWIQAPDLGALLDAFAPEEGRAICAPVADRKRGNPILWATRYFPELRLLDGDVGARHLLSRYEDDLCEVAVEGGGVLRDVDTPEALGRGRGRG
jgi:molybdenum cofactor cytidylyltransferase